MDADVRWLALMWGALVSGIAMANQPDVSNAHGGDGSAQCRSLTAIGVDVSNALRDEAVARRRRDSTAEVLRLIQLYHELAEHPRRHYSHLAARLGQQLRSRLRNVRDHITTQTGAENHGKSRKMPASARRLPKNHVLAQIAPGAGVVAGGFPTAAGVPNDYGPELVELIQQTISPATWDINGGDGAVVYYAPLRVLVVRAPSDVHEQIGGVLGQLRAAP